ncbi:hypothetical protein ACE6H2_006977 [Prunus campanulata]
MERGDVEGLEDDQRPENDQHPENDQGSKDDQQPPLPQEPYQPLFIKNLLEFLKVPSSSGVRWSPEGTSVIFGLNAGSYFRDHYPSLKYCNVPRQLQQFGFSKIGGGAVSPGEMAYKHDLFRQALPELRFGIRRKQTKSATTAFSSSASGSNVDMLLKAVFEMDKRLDNLISLITGRNLLSTPPDEPPCDKEIGN